MSVLTRSQVNVFRSQAAMPTVRNVPQAANDVIHVRKDDVERLDGDHRWRMIICREGMVWITQERDWRDYVLEPGDVFVVTQRGQVLVQAIEDARVEVTPSLKAAPYAGQLPAFD